MQPRFPSPAPCASRSPESQAPGGVGGLLAHKPCTSPPIPSPGPRAPNPGRLRAAARRTPRLETWGKEGPLAQVQAQGGRHARPLPRSPPCTPRHRAPWTHLAGPGLGPGRGAGPGPGVGDGAPSAGGVLGARAPGALARPAALLASAAAASLPLQSPYSTAKPRMMLATPFLVSPRARGVLPCLKGAAAAAPPRPARPPHPVPGPRRPEQALQVRSCHVPALPWGFAPLRRGARAVIRFCVKLWV